MPPESSQLYDLDALFHDAKLAIESVGARKGVADVPPGGEAAGVVDDSTCRKCGASDNTFMVDVRNNQCVCVECGTVDSRPIQCEWNVDSQQLELGARRFKRKTAVYNHTYYFSEKMRCANAEGVCLFFVYPLRSAGHLLLHVVHVLVERAVVHAVHVRHKLQEVALAVSSPHALTLPAFCLLFANLLLCLHDCRVPLPLEIGDLPFSPFECQGQPVQ